MKCFKCFTILLLSAFTSLSVQAATASQLYQRKAEKPNTQVQQKAAESALQQFVNSVQLRFMGVDLHSVNNQVVVEFKYALSNKVNKAIRKVHWKATYLANDKAIFTQDEPLILPQPLVGDEPLPLTFSVPLAQFPQPAQEALLNAQNQFSAQFQAKSIEFSDGSTIVVE